MHQGGDGGEGGGPEKPPRRQRAMANGRPPKSGRDGTLNQGGGRGGDSDGSDQDGEPSGEYRVVLSGLAHTKVANAGGFGPGFLWQAVHQVRRHGGSVPFLFALRLRPQSGTLAIAFVDYMALMTFAFDLVEDPALRTKYSLWSRGEFLAKMIGLPTFRAFVSERLPDLPLSWQAYVEFGAVRFGSLTWLQKVGIAFGMVAATSGTMATAPTAVRNYNEIYGPALQDAIKVTDEYILLFSERVGDRLDVKVTPASPRPAPGSPAGTEAPAHPPRGGTRKRRKSDPTTE